MTQRHIAGRMIQPGSARGALLKLETASLWGAIDPASGRLTDPTIAHVGQSVAGRLLAIARPRGSSSSSAVMLELLHNGHAPAGIILAQIDAILGLGIAVAREMGWRTIPMLLIEPAAFAAIPDGRHAEITTSGLLQIND